MLVYIFGIKDKLVGFPRLFTDQNYAVAIRGFGNAIKREIDNPVSDVSPTDLELYVFGTFDTSIGEISLYSSPDLIYSGFDVLHVYSEEKENEGGKDHEV